MKIIQVIPVFSMGGAEIMCETLTYELKKLGHEVIAVSLYSIETPITERLKNAGVDVRFLGKKRGLDFSIFSKLKKLFKHENPDAVHSHNNASQYAFPIAKQMGIKMVHTVHSIATKELPKSSRLINGYFFKKHAAVPVALSEKVQKTIQEEYKMSTDNIPVVFNGIDLSRCTPKESYEFEDTFKVVHVGRFCDVKNHIGLVSAFELFHREYANTELHLIGDGELRNSVETIVREKNLEECIIFHGLQSDVHEFLNKMDVFTLPSIYEGIPMTIIEAMGTGLPVVATDVGGIPDMITNGENGILTAVDPYELAQAYAELYNNRELREKLGQNAIMRANAFSSTEMAKRYFEIYEQ